ncbi:hypothetical protein [Povalibacter sp.]|uniref:hypothetical protein n=1 Tax=Povalibacter sp. TaxID=1962978 RepID=UPI002F428982
MNSLVVSSRGSPKGRVGLLISLALATAIVPAFNTAQAEHQSDRFQRRGPMSSERDDASARGVATEAPTGFHNRTNGFNVQGPAFDTITEETVVPLRSFNDNRFIFEEVETVADGLGPTYNAQSAVGPAHPQSPDA